MKLERITVSNAEADLLEESGLGRDPISLYGADFRFSRPGEEAIYGRIVTIGISPFEKTIAITTGTESFTLGYLSDHHWWVISAGQQKEGELQINLGGYVQPC